MRFIKRRKWTIIFGLLFVASFYGMVTMALWGLATTILFVVAFVASGLLLNTALKQKV